MENELTKYIHVGFVGRLEIEKGADIFVHVLEKVREDKELRNKIIFHVIGEGSFLDNFRRIKSSSNIHLHIHGKLSHTQVQEEMKKWDLLCMPSRFLETFGLVALEAVTHGLQICGPNQGGLSEFIKPEFIIDMNHPVEDILKILIRIEKKSEDTSLSVEKFGYTSWQNNLKKIIGVRKNILIIHDYNSAVGGAEAYIDFLQHELKNIGCKVHRFGYTGKLNRFIKILHLILTPIAVWRYRSVKKIIKKMSPDLIWMHSIMRYIGPWGTFAVHQNTQIPTIISHHDLGLICARPSMLENEKDIPRKLDFTSFVLSKTKNPIEWIMRAIKFISVKLIWKYLKKVDIHIVPSGFMKGPVEDISNKETIVFPHTLIHTSSSKMSVK